MLKRNISLTETILLPSLNISIAKRSFILASHNHFGLKSTYLTVSTKFMVIKRFGSKGPKSGKEIIKKTSQAEMGNCPKNPSTLGQSTSISKMNSVPKHSEVPKGPQMPKLASIIQNPPKKLESKEVEKMPGNASFLQGHYTTPPWDKVFQVKPLTKSSSMPEQSTTSADNANTTTSTSTTTTSTSTNSVHEIIFTETSLIDRAITLGILKYKDASK